jgi:hypothetical protein
MSTAEQLTQRPKSASGTFLFHPAHGIMDPVRQSLELRGQGMMRRTILFFLFFGLRAVAAIADDSVLVEAESLKETGGWMVDQQFMDLMGSPYLLAHGLGEPVPDATGEVTFPIAGDYRVWVRTRDWVTPWKAPGAPGRFQVLINGQPLAETFGTEGAKWHWQDGGTIQVGHQMKVSLHDLTGFEGRCDAVLFCHDTKFIPPDDGVALTK